MKKILTIAVAVVALSLPGCTLLLEPIIAGEVTGDEANSTINKTWDKLCDAISDGTVARGENGDCNYNLFADNSAAE